MLKVKSLFLLVFVSFNCFSQQNKLWKSYFSYYAVKDLSSSAAKVYAAAENALFSKHLVTNELKTTTTVDGFTAETITAMHHSEVYNKTLVGNSNGLLLVVNETDGSVLNVIDIVTKPSIPPNRKKINDIYEYEGKIYLSCDYGISVFNLSNSQFGDTYFIGPAGEEVEVLQTTVFNGFLYAVTRNNGIRKASVTNPNLVDFTQWTLFDGGFWSGIETFQGKLVAANTSQRVYTSDGGFFQELVYVAQPILDLETYGNRLAITSSNHVYFYNDTFTQIAHITQIPEVTTTFTCATAVNDNLFIGTADKGVFSTTTGNASALVDITPNGPLRNSIFNLKKGSGLLWAVYGDYSKEYNPYPLESYEVSKYNELQGWTFIPFGDLFNARSLTQIALNPFNSRQIFVSSFNSGLLKIENGVPVTLYNNLNTGANGLESMVPDPGIEVRVNASAFDKEGSLWLTNSRVDRALKVFKKNGQWSSFDLEPVTTNPAEDSYAALIIDENGTKWIPSYRNGVIAFNENYGNKFAVIKPESEEGTLPSPDVRCLAIDTKNQLWIGTFKGLRVLQNVDRFLTDQNLETNSIIITDEGLAQELFYQQSVMDIAVDGANKKWVAIDGAGVFLISYNGQQTIYHFTKENSPLPSNNINDIEIDGTTGEVFFATDKGLVSFKGVATQPSENLNNVYIYPNPVRPEFNGTVKISGLVDKANIKITDIEGNLVYETTSVGGTIEWDTTAFGKYKVASGVYMVFIVSEDGSETKVKKVMIVR